MEPLLHRVEPKPGDCILIESGTVHAIGAGVLLAEIQQTSDATFRVYDWGRVGPDGKPRTLHIEQALESIDFERGPVEPITPRIEPLSGGGNCEHFSRSAYFALERLEASESDAGGTTRSVHDPDGPGGLIRSAAWGGIHARRIRPDGLASRCIIGDARLYPKARRRS